MNAIVLKDHLAEIFCVTLIDEHHSCMYTKIIIFIYDIEILFFFTVLLKESMDKIDVLLFIYVVQITVINYSLKLYPGCVGRNLLYYYEKGKIILDQPYPPAVVLRAHAY